MHNGMTSFKLRFCVQTKAVINVQDYHRFSLICRYGSM